VLYHSARTAWKLDVERHDEMKKKDVEIASYQQKLEDAATRLHDGRPQLNLMILAEEILKWNDGQLVFAIQNSGQRPARFIEIKPIPSLTGKYDLRLRVVGNEVLTPNMRPIVSFEVFEVGETNPQYIVDAMKTTTKMLQLFFKDGEKAIASYPVETSCHDAGPSIFVDHVILECERKSMTLAIKPAF
jgi:hypothetical protein